MNRRVLSDMPPITVVTTSAPAGSSSRKGSKNNAQGPIILMKPPSKQSQSPWNNNKDPIIAITSRPANYAPTGSTAMVDSSGNGNGNTNACNVTIASTSDTSATAVNNDKQVDSALLSALRDKRERMGLLRLEKNLVEFMNDKNCGFMEVGGAGNSTVIRGASGGGGIGSGPTSPDSEGDAGIGIGAVRSQNVGMGMGMNGYNGNDGTGGRQTSFQRLCLHRLADRFNIVREQGYNNPSQYANNNPGLIRLVKVKESRIPTVKLINLDLSQYDQSPPQDRGEGFGVMGITDRLASTQLQEGGNAKKSKKKEKVKIMKRSSSNSLINEQKKSASKRKGKKLSDKEKAYAEARARIFNDSNHSSVNGTTLEGSDHAVGGSSHHSLTPPGSRDRSAATSPVLGKSASPLDNSKDSVLLVPSQLASTGASVVNSLKDSKATRGNLPAAATGGAASKVTWRNREQEASDPDFQRRHHPGMIQPMTMHPQYHVYAQTGMMGNGYGHHAPHASGYQYGVPVPVDGQMYNQGQLYTTPNSHYQADGSWLPFDAQAMQQTHHQQDYRSPSEDTNAVQKDIDLSQDEFPSLR